MYQLLQSREGGGLSLLETESAGTAPSGITIEPNGQFLYVANGNSDNVSAYTILGTGALTALSGSPFPAENTPVGIASPGRP